MHREERRWYILSDGRSTLPGEAWKQEQSILDGLFFGLPVLETVEVRCTDD